MTTSLIIGGQPDSQDAECFKLAGDLAAQAEHVRIIMRSGHAPHGSACTEECTHAFEAVGYDTHADPGRRDHDTAIAVAA